MRWKAAAIAMVACLACLACAGASGAAQKPAPEPATQAVNKPPAVAASAPAGAASGAVQGLSEEQRRSIAQIVKAYVVPRFTVLADDRLDADLRTAAEGMQAEHPPRVQALMERWTIEELQQPDPQRATLRMMARLMNEFALWGRDSTGPAYDGALAQALKVSGMCRPVSTKSGDLVLRLSRLRVLPQPLRSEALQAERELLARWGTPRRVDDAEPLPAEDELLRLRAIGLAPKTPVPPVLAQFYLGDDEDSRRDPLLAEGTVRCALHQWAGANPAQFRAALALQTADFTWRSRLEAIEPTADDNPYPKFANFYGIEGVVTVHVDINARGQVVRAKVVKRDVRVPGVRDARPFAHENVLDLATLAKARAMDWSAAAPKEGLRSVQREFVWSLK